MNNIEIWTYDDFIKDMIYRGYSYNTAKKKWNNHSNGHNFVLHFTNKRKLAQTYSVEYLDKIFNREESKYQGSVFDGNIKIM